MSPIFGVWYKTEEIAPPLEFYVTNANAKPDFFHSSNVQQEIELLTCGAISSVLYHTPKMGDILKSWCYCVKNVSKSSIVGQWWRNDPCVSSFLLQNFFTDHFVNMSHTNFWQFFQISDLFLHDRCLLKLFYNTYWAPWFNKTLFLKFEQVNQKLWTKTHFCTVFVYALNFSVKLLTKSSLYNKLGWI